MNTNLKKVVLNADKVPADEHLNLGIVNAEAYFKEYKIRHGLKMSNDKFIDFSKGLFQYHNHFLNTFLSAYNYHLGLHITPDDIMLCINNIISKYISELPEKFRGLFVAHDGKKLIHIELDPYMHYTVEKNGCTMWDMGVVKTCEAIENDVKDKQFLALMTCNFTTTTHLEKISSLAYIMDTVKHYYELKWSTCCGIPYVYLHGSVDDWMLLKDKVSKLIEFFKSTDDTLPKYLNDEIIPIIDMFIKTYSNTDDKPVIDFWAHCLSHQTRHGSGGGTDWNGWLMKLVPYVSRKYTSRLDHESKKVVRTPTDNAKIYAVERIDNDIISSVTSVPITFDDNGKVSQLSLAAGIQGTTQFTDGSVGCIRGYFLYDVNNVDDLKKNPKELLIR